MSSGVTSADCKREGSSPTCRRQARPFRFPADNSRYVVSSLSVSFRPHWPLHLIGRRSLQIGSLHCDNSFRPRRHANANGPAHLRQPVHVFAQPLHREPGRYRPRHGSHAGAQDGALHGAQLGRCRTGRLQQHRSRQQQQPVVNIRPAIAKTARRRRIRIRVSPVLRRRRP